MPGGTHCTQPWQVLDDGRHHNLPEAQGLWGKACSVPSMSVHGIDVEDMTSTLDDIWKSLMTGIYEFQRAWMANPLFSWFACVSEMG